MFPRSVSLLPRVKVKPANALVSQVGFFSAADTGCACAVPQSIAVGTKKAPATNAKMRLEISAGRLFAGLGSSASIDTGASNPGISQPALEMRTNSTPILVIFDFI